MEILQDSPPPTLFLKLPATTSGLAMPVEKMPVNRRVGEALNACRGLHAWVHSSPATDAVTHTNKLRACENPV